MHFSENVSTAFVDAFFRCTLQMHSSRLHIYVLFTFPISLYHIYLHYSIVHFSLQLAKLFNSQLLLLALFHLRNPVLHLIEVVYYLHCIYQHNDVFITLSAQLSESRIFRILVLTAMFLLLFAFHIPVLGQLDFEQILCHNGTPRQPSCVFEFSLCISVRSAT